MLYCCTAVQSGQGLLVLPPHCEIFLVRTLKTINFLGGHYRSNIFNESPSIISLIIKVHIVMIPENSMCLREVDKFGFPFCALTSLRELFSPLCTARPDNLTSLSTKCVIKLCWSLKFRGLKKSEYNADFAGA